MFEQHQDKTKSALWKILPLALLLFAGIVAVIVILSRPDASEEEALTRVLHKGDPDYDWYQKYVELTDPKISMGKNVAGNRLVMLSGVIHNDGEKPLDVVEVKVVFYNYEEAVWETIRTPVRPGPYTPAIPPLQKRGFDFYVDEIPEDWMANHAEMSIAGFRFQEEED